MVPLKGIMNEAIDIPATTTRICEVGDQVILGWGDRKSVV